MLFRGKYLHKKAQLLKFITLTGSQESIKRARWRPFLRISEKLCSWLGGPCQKVEGIEDEAGEIQGLVG